MSETDPASPSPQPPSPAAAPPASPTLEDRVSKLESLAHAQGERLEESDTQVRALLELLKLRHVGAESRLDRIEERLVAAGFFARPTRAG